jgi:hypothetical protein
MTVSSTRIFGAAAALVAIHIVDAELVRPQPGTSARDHLSAALVPLLVAAVAAAGFGRLRPGWRAAIAATFGILSLVAGGVALAGGLAGSDFTGLLLLPAGVALIALACVIPWRERAGRASTRRRRWINRAIATVAGLGVAFFVLLPVALALVMTHRQREPVVPLRRPRIGRSPFTPPTGFGSPAGGCRRATAPPS